MQIKSLLLIAALALSPAGYALPTVSIAATDWAASEAGLATATIRVTSSPAAPTGGLVVKYSISGIAQKNDNANSSPDFLVAPSGGTATTGSVTITAGATTANITITPMTDSLFEGSEAAVFTLTADAAYTLGDPRKTQFIIADNNAVPTVNPDHASGDAGGWIVPISGTLPNKECSGMAASRQYPGVVWYHRDGTTNTNDPREKIYAIEISNGTSNNGTVIKTIDVLAPVGWSGTWENKQWEDMSLDPDDPTKLWIADIGNNSSGRTDVVFFKLTEPDPYGSGTTVMPTAFYARYPSGLAFNAEAFFVFEGLPHIVVKESNPRVYRCPTATLSTDKANPTIMELVGTTVGDPTNPSVATFSFDRKRMVLSAHLRMFVYVSQSSLDPTTTTLTPAQAKTYVQDLLCTRNPSWALQHNGGKTDPEATPQGSVEGGCFVGDGYDILLGAEGQEVIHLPAWWYETQAYPIPLPPLAPNGSAVNALPNLDLTKPSDTASYSKSTQSPLLLRAFAWDANDAIANVKFYYKLTTDSTYTLVGTGSQISPGGQYEFSWNLSGVATGTYNFKAEATDTHTPTAGVTAKVITITINP